jgi:hypothetical protein
VLIIWFLNTNQSFFVESKQTSAKNEKLKFVHHRFHKELFKVQLWNIFNKKQFYLQLKCWVLEMLHLMLHDDIYCFHLYYTSSITTNCLIWFAFSLMLFSQLLKVNNHSINFFFDMNLVLKHWSTDVLFCFLDNLSILHEKIKWNNNNVSLTLLIHWQIFKRSILVSVKRVNMKFHC